MMLYRELRRIFERLKYCINLHVSIIKKFWNYNLAIRLKKILFYIKLLTYDIQYKLHKCKFIFFPSIKKLSNIMSFNIFQNLLFFLYIYKNNHQFNF